MTRGKIIFIQNDFLYDSILDNGITCQKGVQSESYVGF